MGIFVGYSQKRRSVRIASPGKDQVVICNETTISLHATLTDEFNVRNHTFYWEQLTGVPVILDNTDQLETGYSFVETTNKKFRFYLDYGTNKEQYKDVEIFHTPTSIVRNFASRGAAKSINQTIPNYALSSDFLIPYNLYPEAPIEGVPAVRVDYSVLSAELLAATTGMQVLTSTGYTQDPQDVYASYTPGNYPSKLVLPRGVYKVVLHYNFSNNLRAYTSPLIVSTSSPVEDPWDVPYVNDLMFVSRSGARFVEGSMKRFNYVNKTLPIDPGMRVSRSLGNYVQTMRRFTYFSKSYQDSDFTIGRSLGNFYSITRFDSSNIGNG